MIWIPKQDYVGMSLRRRIPENVFTASLPTPDARVSVSGSPKIVYLAYISKKLAGAVAHGAYVSVSCAALDFQNGILTVGYKVLFILACYLCIVL